MTTSETKLKEIEDELSNANDVGYLQDWVSKDDIRFLLDELKKEQIAVQNAELAFIAYEQQIESLRVENEKLKARFCSHGAYVVWGTDECPKCETGRVTLYYLPNERCFKCEGKKERLNDLPKL